MKLVLFRALGFLLPTLVLTTTQHLMRDARFGEAVDGVVTSLWFMSFFLAGGLLGELPSLMRGAGRRGTNAREALLGFAAAVFTWSLLWLVWSLPQMDPLRHRGGFGFAINSAAVLAAGLVLRIPLPIALKDPWPRRPAGS